MKTQEQLYRYCIQSNLHTRRWMQSLTDACCKEISIWKNSAASSSAISYSSKKLETAADELYLILTEKCGEQTFILDVYAVADRILKDVAKNLSLQLQSSCHRIVMRVNSSGEGIFFIGPCSLPYDILFSNEGIFMRAGYDLLIGFLEQSGRCTMQELYLYLKNHGLDLLE